jgi:hypothetical protein
MRNCGPFLLSPSLMTLNKYLTNIGLFTGPRPYSKNTSHSGLDVLRRNLFGIPLFQGGEEFLKFGVALHDVFLQDDFEVYNTLLPWQQQLIDKLVEKLRAHPVVMRLFKGSRREKKKYKKMNGVRVAYILDIHQVAALIGADLKTTVCTTLQECLKKSILYGYHKQRHIYKQVEKLKEFYFIFICKKFPHDIFIIGDKDFKPYEDYARKEIEWLTYVYKNYGRFATEEDLNPKSNMTDKAKKVMTEIESQFKSYRGFKKENERAAREIKKSKDKIIKLISSFPKNEAPLHKEKFDKIISGL